MLEEEKRISDLMVQMKSYCDAVLIQSDTNRRYFTGMLSSAGTLLCFPEESYLIIDFRYIEKARQVVQHCTVIEQHELTKQLTDLLKQHHAKTLSVEAMTMTLSEYHKLKRELRNVVELDDSDKLSRAIYHCRTVKSEAEIKKIRAAQRIAEAAFQDILTYLRPGISERDVMMRLNDTMQRFGSEGESFPTIALTGAATSMPHGVPTTERLIQEGDFVLMDYGAMVDGYHSDMTRTVCVGRPSDKMRQIYETVLAAQTAALQAVKAGITGRALDKIARDVITDAGYGDAFGHSLGHGVGMEIHEYPNASPGSKATLESGNVVTIEPGIYLPGEFGVRIEDFVVIREEGCENLTLAPKELLVLEG
ncbi:MAG: aminopeptidase P family protein [Ruminococcus sp.]|nr:aminopeptidase P family protein [Ruminococcus sp.]